MKNIQVKVSDKMTQAQRDSIIENPYTINLTGELSTNQKKQRMRTRIKERKRNNLLQKLKNKLEIPIMIIIFCTLVVFINNVTAEDIVEQKIKEIEQSETIETEDIEALIEMIDNSLNTEEEDIDTSIFPTEEWDKEMREYFDRPTYEEFMEEWERLHRLKYEEQKKNDEINESAFNFIIQFEWYHDKPYWDYKQWSCGYGMKCNKNTTWITKEKSKQYVIDRIENIRKKYDLYKYDDNIQVALISFAYNVWHIPAGTDWYIENWYINGLKNHMKEYSYAGGKYMRWLAKRRNAETSLF